MNVCKNLTFLFSIFLFIGAKEEWGVDVKWHICRRDYFENTLVAFLQVVYLPEGDVDKKLKSAGWKYDGFVFSVLENDCGREIWME